MFTLGIDCRFASKYTGLGNYTRSLTEKLLSRQDPWATVIFVTSKKEKWLERLQGSSHQVYEAPFSHYSFREQAAFPVLIKKTGCDLLFSPHFNVPFGLNIPFVCTIHDLILHQFPNRASYLKKIAYRFLVRNSVNKAAGIITVSQATKNEIFRRYGKNAEDKTQVIYPGIDPVFDTVSETDKIAIKKKYEIGGDYLLYVGNCKQHKNVPVLLEAFEAADLKGVTMLLVCSGEECVRFNRLNDVKIIKDVPHNELPAFYAAALSFVTATLMEGFGFPVLEAMACRCPVIATDCGSLPEVCGGSAILVKPSVNELSSAMKHLAENGNGIINAPKTGIAQAWAKSFTWERTAAQVAGVISNELQSR